MKARRHSRPADDPQAQLIERARRLRRKGEARKALAVLREACLRDEGAAWLWTLYGALCGELGRDDEGSRALAHAVWLRRRAGDQARIRSTRALAERLNLLLAA